MNVDGKKPNFADPTILIEEGETDFKFIVNLRALTYQSAVFPSVRWPSKLYPVQFYDLLASFNSRRSNSFNKEV